MKKKKEAAAEAEQSRKPEQEQKTEPEQKPEQDQKPAAEAEKPKTGNKPKAGKKPKLEKKIYIIVCAALVFLLAGVVTLILMITTGGKKDKALKQDEDVSAVEPSSEGEDEPEPPGEEEPPEEKPEKEAEPEDEPEEDPEPESKPEAKPERQPDSVSTLALALAAAARQEPGGDLSDEIHTSLSEAVNFVENLSPSLLNLPGDSMAEYEILTNQYIIPVDGLLCSEVMVYNRDESTGTNELMATLLVDRGPGGRLFRKENDTGVVVEVDLTAGE